ncbi:hypothetical protein [Beggiatoa leptomitoformis]|uniref:Uncharacterized protein n=1 Tax=Beggiatoa leptomitoformis TaxID=288004 RepID=A0A2N9YGZ6_9GAMM|nr:hypothetical protein [Beggiatoa leptomitoformis]ALG67903.1 hypothetical protein AL038_09500 [Beggiatoa leptomitoformis]AUI69831.1 hypothetical protein BLE401_14780 [Beggiatoa leptomitoformis]
MNLEHIKQRLKKKRYTLRSWAIQHNFHPRTVDNSLRRAIKRGGTPPRGLVARNIINSIEKTIGKPLF